MTVRSRAGSASQVVPNPPAHPYAPARGPAVTTEVQKPQLTPVRGRGRAEAVQAVRGQQLRHDRSAPGVRRFLPLLTHGRDGINR